MLHQVERIQFGQHNGRYHHVDVVFVEILQRLVAVRFVKHKFIIIVLSKIFPDFGFAFRILTD